MKIGQSPDLYIYGRIVKGTRLCLAELFRTESSIAIAIMDSINSAEHSILVYPDIETFRGIYSQYARKHLEEDSEIMFIVPHYETVSSVRQVLRNSGVNVSKYEKENVLLLMDSAIG